MAHKRPRRKGPVEQWVALLPEQGLVRRDDHQDATHPRIVSLPHPRTGTSCKFVIAEDAAAAASGSDAPTAGSSAPVARVFELQTFSDTVPRSWFIGESVQQDGSLLVGNRIDALFLALPLLEAQTKGSSEQGVFTPLDQLFYHHDFPAVCQLQKCVDLAQLQLICDQKGTKDYTVFRLNRTKLLAWLKVKVERLAAALASSSVHVGAGAHSANFRRTSKGQSATPLQLKTFAVGILGEYLSKATLKELEAALGLDAAQAAVEAEEAAEKAREKAAPSAKELAALESKKRNNPSEEPTEDYTVFNKGSLAGGNAGTKKAKLTPGQRALAKVDKTGMKSLQSFFGRK
eukprot:m.49749 g.49749  ORF g.49749 m.49749 type:complete len:346 (+) comp12099_c0_seq2:231-1268(+)